MVFGIADTAYLLVTALNFTALVTLIYVGRS
jgi:hypothetical protein